MRGGEVNTTTIHQTRDNHGGSEGVPVAAMGNAAPPPSRDLTTIALVLKAVAVATLKAVGAALELPAEAAAAPKADDADGSDGSVVGRTSLMAGG